MPSTTSLDEKLSDVIGYTKYSFFDNKASINYNYALDQNYKDLNYNELETKIDLNPIKFDFGFLQEKKHIGSQEYFKTKIEFSKDKNTIMSF